MSAKRARDGAGGKAHRRASQRLKKETALKGLLCTWCGLPIDTSLPREHRMSFTSDHPEALANGGRLVGQALDPMHRHCNSEKNDNAVVDINEWGAS